MCRSGAAVLPEELPEPPYGRPFGVLRLSVTDEQGNAQRVLERQRRKLGDSRADGRKVAALEGCPEPLSAEAALVDHFGQEDHDPLPSDLHNNLAAARNRAEQPWKERREGKQRLVAQLEAERARFVQDNLGELAAAKESAAHAARERVEQALEAVEAAAREWQGVAQHYSALLAPVEGVDGRDVPELRIDPVRLEAARALERGIPTPLPRSLYEAEDADLTIRSAA